MLQRLCCLGQEALNEATWKLKQPPWLVSAGVVHIRFLEPCFYNPDSMICTPPFASISHSNIKVVCPRFPGRFKTLLRYLTA